MDYTFWTGIIGSLFIVAGAALAERKAKHPVLSVKNWLFAVGGVIMLFYAILGYNEGGPVFFIFLQALVIISSILMMLNLNDIIDTIIISIFGVGLVIWSLTLFEGYNTVFFIVGLTGIGLGYAFEMGTVKRSAALFLGSTLIAVFSYIESSWIFFWLNLIFAIFSGYYLLMGFAAKKRLKKSHHKV